WRAHEHYARALDFHPKNGRIATGGSDGKVCIWDAFGTQHSTMSFDSTGARAARVAYSPDGQRVAVLDQAGWLAFWLPSRKEGPPWLNAGMDLSRPADHDLVYAPDGRSAYLAVNIGIVSVRPGRNERVVWPSDPPRAVRAVSISPDG